MNEETKKSILEMARGGFMERVDYEMPRIIDNILDANTKATAKRKITLTMEFLPDDDRSNIVANVSIKTALAPTNPIRTMLYIAGSNATGEMQVVENAPQVPGQTAFDGTEQSAPATLRLIQCS